MAGQREQLDKLDKLDKGAALRITKLHNTLRDGPGECDIRLDDRNVRVRHDLSGRRVDVLPAGGAIPWNDGSEAGSPMRGRSCQ
ncbi:crotonobetainyl-CoA--carnitine CoA-transferase [Mycobacterium avium subsp. hominissuis]|uniref:crotonobetainyl-CoA--carnitine CoA-transferase n=1 Tax=Mycobacterium avium TaxID=1764 RepID=UPI0004CEF550|nr:crotonobetainyl-CoA--carnitine CoA-transferase [Mycobacterium avium]ATO65251.1 crotonobetainyl-CoA--carnitine CoA-transferase [Mycobacterium avium subsp. hominissuis]ATO69831.1 crotonobetainyl-CoA--carnitine CoA-transferase [Mycobacterium avium subsp. hominissuis]ATO74281.1 crotonobetainyl-CoA--carnitine CoA-transferase [Mycobacterium avium subsp. hominissuis]PBJ31808.1 crotonobetainyl-CoA--carnitine CoA-transferase [Mycobacterium avium subsp. hominissuis]PBJ67162.1 crotonobetainyl-CoA--car